MSRAHRAAGGFTILEVLLAVTIFFIMLAAVGSTAGVATRTMQTNDRRAETSEKVMRFLQRITQLTRGGVVSTFRVEATQADVDSGRATAIGEWIEPVDGERRTVIQFQAADGILALRASSLTPPVVLRFATDPGEAAGTSGRDDDNDFLIDEGRVVFTNNGIDTGILSGIETCSFVLEGFLLTVEIRSARSTRSSHQFHFRQVFSLRNN